MNKHQKQLLKKVDEAYDNLRELNNITWTSYIDELFTMNRKSEKRHREFTKGDYEANLSQIARFWTVQQIAKAYLKVESYGIKSLLHIRYEVLYAQSIVENHKVIIEQGWENINIQEIANIDYISLIDYSLYEEQQERRIEEITLSA